MKVVVQYFGAGSWEELKPRSSSPAAESVGEFRDLRLLLKAPLAVRMGDKVFMVEKEGLYRFFDLGGADLRQAYLYQGDLWALLGNLSRMRVHGWRDMDAPSPQEKIERARRGRLSLTCGPTAQFVAEQARTLGVKCRFVHTLTLDEWNDYDNGHSLLEVFDPAEKRWILYDSDLGCRLRHQGRWLDLGEACRLYREGRLPEAVYPAGKCQMDPHAEQNLPNANAFYSSMFEGIFVRDEARDAWFRRVMQVPIIDGVFPSDSEAETLRARAYAGGNYAKQALPWTEWRKRFYE